MHLPATIRGLHWLLSPAQAKNLEIVLFIPVLLFSVTGYAQTTVPDTPAGRTRILEYLFHLAVATLALPMLTMMSAGLVHPLAALASAGSLHRLYSGSLGYSVGAAIHRAAQPRLSGAANSSGACAHTVVAD